MFLQLGDEFGNYLIVMHLESLKFGKPGYKKAFKRARKQRRSHFKLQKSKSKSRKSVRANE